MKDKEVTNTMESVDERVERILARQTRPEAAGIRSEGDQPLNTRHVGPGQIDVSIHANAEAENRRAMAEASAPPKAATLMDLSPTPVDPTEVVEIGSVLILPKHYAVGERAFTRSPSDWQVFDGDVEVTGDVALAAIVKAVRELRSTKKAGK
jgi:hypothetical protein